MQIKCLHKSIYTLNRYADRHQRALNINHPYYESVTCWEKLKSEGVTDKLAQEITGMSRASYYRRRDKLEKGEQPGSRRPRRVRQSKVDRQTEQLVCRIRRENPTYGKFKVWVILSREHGIQYSESTIGRVLSRLMERGVIKKSASSPRRYRARQFKAHAKRWRYGDKARKAGELIQVDHMSVSKYQRTYKHFQAWDPTTRCMVADVYTSATSRSARSFLAQIRHQLPFEVISIQVDGGSEFMGEFERACEELGIKLYVLPPRRPQYNGGVERGNRIFREEFYAREDLRADTVSQMRIELRKAVRKYNEYRPHHSLKGLTPMEYTAQILRDDSVSYVMN